jgi:predicted ribosomally synthesized peptide with nif11-like leader
MSVADLKEYGKRASTDPAVRAKAKSIGLQDIKGQAEYAKTLGLDFTAEDMKTLAREVQPKGELTDDQLNAVAGGVVSATAAAAVGVVGAVVGTATAVTAVTSTTSGGGW